METFLTPEPAHALLSASGSHKWLHCTPSMRMEQRFPDESSEYAEEGSLAHAMGAKSLKLSYGFDHSGEDREIAELKGRYFTPEMALHAVDYADFVCARFEAMKERAKAAGTFRPSIRIEERLQYDQWVPQGFGTGDAVLLAEGEMEIIDLKYGKGVKVDAFKNPQLMIYALAAFTDADWVYEPGKVTMTIFQPRLGHVSTYETTAAALLEWAEKVLKPTAQLAWEGKGETSKGAWCRFCKAKRICPQHAPDAFPDFDI